MPRPLLASSLLAVAFCAGCVYPRRAASSSESLAFDRPQETSLGRRFGLDAIAHPEQSGLYVLEDGLDAFAARVAVVDHSERALDVQYYIFHDDLTGRLLLGRLLAAADRGVRVRLLIDDLGSQGIDELMARANAHPSLEVRLFNPFARGPWSWLARSLDMLWRPLRLNHRMHNKMLAGDGAVAVVGGRNVGDEYFSADEEVEFGDMDLLAFGPVNRELGESFDLYWNSEFVAPLSGWRSLRRDARDLAELRAELAALELESADSRYVERLRGSNFVQQALAEDLDLIWGRTHAVADLPRKIVARGDGVAETLLIERVRPYWPNPREDLSIVSAYFIPRERGITELARVVEVGGRVRVLTNSLAATDVAIVHSAYKNHRRALLEAGIELYELMPHSAAVLDGYKQGWLGSSSAALHAKTFVSDRRRVFVGSLNFDPRSVDLNTELGLVVDSPQLAERILRTVDRSVLPDISWRLALEDGELVWYGEPDGTPLRLTTEPGTNWWLRSKIWFLGLLPIEGQL